MFINEFYNESFLHHANGSNLDRPKSGKTFSFLSIWVWIYRETILKLTKWLKIGMILHLVLPLIRLQFDLFYKVHSNWVYTTDRKPLISIKERKHFYFSSLHSKNKIYKGNPYWFFSVIYALSQIVDLQSYSREMRWAFSRRSGHIACPVNKTVYFE